MVRLFLASDQNNIGGRERARPFVLSCKIIFKEQNFRNKEKTVFWDSILNPSKMMESWSSLG